MEQRKKIFLIIFCLIIALISVFINGDHHERKYCKKEFSENGSTYAYTVKTAAYWTSPIMSSSDVMNLAKHDIVIADLENQFNNRANLLELKRLNPGLILIAYSNPMEVFVHKLQNRPWQDKVIDELSKRPQWFLRTINRKSGHETKKIASYWPGMIMLNMSSACPKIYFRNYSKWMAKKIKNEILCDSVWDGYFMDNGLSNISWIYPNSNEKIMIDGKNENSNSETDQKWKEGVGDYLSIIKTTNKIIISNRGSLDFLDKIDGKLFENHPNNYLGSKWANGWKQCFDNTKKTGPLTIFKVDRNNIMFGLTSCLLHDNVYLAIGQDDAGYFPELNVDLGFPQGKTKSNLRGTIFYRCFEKGVVIVEPLKKRGVIKLFKAKT